MPKPQHLARHQNADLFLDTPICNAHTTAADSLWAGVPLITCPGDRFTDRVAASVLTAAGLEELIVPDLESYEQLALVLAQNADRLGELRQRIAEECRSSPLFDTSLRVRELECAFETIWQRHIARQSPATILVTL